MLSANHNCFMNTKDELFEDDWFKILVESDEPEQIRVMPVRKVIYPYEEWYEQVTNPDLQKLLLAEYETTKFIGMLYSPGGGKSLPPLGTLATGTVFSLKQINPKNFMVKYFGWMRCETLEYLEKDTLYPLTEVEYFEDDEEEDEQAIRRELERTCELHEETTRIRGYQDQKGSLRMFLDSKRSATMVSFWLMKNWGGIPETRRDILALRSTVKRLQYANALIAQYNKKEAVAERNARFN